jgi:hypothetical protein
MSVRRAFVFCAALLILPATALAATLQSINGEVLVDSGGGFNVVSGPVTLNPGDTVIANPGSSAQIVYDNGCTVPVQPGAVVAVHAQPPCSTEAEGGSSGGGISSTALLVGGAAVGLGVGAAVLLSADDDEGPASP